MGSVQLSSELERPQVGAFDAGGSALGQIYGPRLAGPACFVVIEDVRPVWQRTVIDSGAYILLRLGSPTQYIVQESQTVLYTPKSSKDMIT